MSRHDYTCRPMDSSTIIHEAQALSFSTAACTRIPENFNWGERFAQWIAQGAHGEMAWMARTPERRQDPRVLLEGARSIICVTYNYYTEHQHSADPRTGRISRYAWGSDYHEIMLAKLKALQSRIDAAYPQSTSLAYVDTGPVLEKPWAAHAGLGWQGKHTNLIDRRRGSWFFLGEIITTAEVPNSVAATGAHTPPSTQASCGSCTRCIDICPTQAITAPYQVDARRCIAYLTIELKGSIPEELRPLLGNHIYGCDLCQDTCPWNRFATPCTEPEFQPRAGNLSPALIPLMTMTDEQFRERFRGSPIKRIKRRRLLRNVAVALGNSKDPAAIPALRQALHDSEELIREHAQWALEAIHI